TRHGPAGERRGDRQIRPNGWARWSDSEPGSRPIGGPREHGNERQGGGEHEHRTHGPHAGSSSGPCPAPRVMPQFRKASQAPPQDAEPLAGRYVQMSTPVFAVAVDTNSRGRALPSSGKIRLPPPRRIG